MGAHSSIRQRGVAAALLVVSSFLMVALEPVTVRLKPDAASRIEPDTTPVIRVPDATPQNIQRECETQAARMAAWCRRIASGASGHEPAWLGRYSSRDDVCYAVIAATAAVANSEQTAPLVTELWNAWEATLLASFTSDGRPEMRRDFCRIDLSENPFTSCLTAEFFVRQHLAN
jgi:hypothetical protein